MKVVSTALGELLYCSAKVLVMSGGIVVPPGAGRARGEPERYLVAKGPRARLSYPVQLLLLYTKHARALACTGRPQCSTLSGNRVIHLKLSVEIRATKRCSSTKRARMTFCSHGEARCQPAHGEQDSPQDVAVYDLPELQRNCQQESQLSESPTNRCVLAASGIEPQPDTQLP